MSLSPDELRELAKIVLLTRPDEISCDDWLGYAPSYVELVATSQPVPEPLRKAAEHLDLCLECAEEFRALLAALKDDGAECPADDGHVCADGRWGSDIGLKPLGRCSTNPNDENGKEQRMSDLIERSIEAHGGLDRWNEVRQVSATLTLSGLGLIQKGQERFSATPTTVTVDTNVQRATFEPFLGAGQKGVYEPTRTTVEAADGTVLEELKSPRDSFKGVAPEGHWSATQLAYFAGYAMWTYFTLPFSLRSPGVQCEEVGPCDEDGETWRTLRVTFPKSFATHSTEQTLYIDGKGLIRRHDYAVEVSGGAQVAHYLYDHKSFDGFVFPTRRQVFPRDSDAKPQKDVVVFTVGLSDFRFARSSPSARG